MHLEVPWHTAYIIWWHFFLLTIPGFNIQHNSLVHNTLMELGFRQTEAAAASYHISSFEYFIWSLIAKIAVNAEKCCKICDGNDDDVHNIWQFRGNVKVRYKKHFYSKSYSHYLENYRPYNGKFTKCYVPLCRDAAIRINTRPSISANSGVLSFVFYFGLSYLFKFSRMNAMP